MHPTSCLLLWVHRQLPVLLPDVSFPIVFQFLCLFRDWYLSIFSPSHSEPCNIHNKCLIATLLVNTEKRWPRLDGHNGWSYPIISDLFCFPLPLPIVFIPFLTSANVILTKELPVDQPGNIIICSLVLFLWESLTLAKNVIYCFILLLTHYKAGNSLTCRSWT